MPTGSPDWSDRYDSDPGIPLLELFAFLMSGLLLGAVARRLLPASTLRVTVDGEEWHEVECLAEAGPDDSVYRVEPETGSIEFGDGVHGRLPQTGAKVRTRYRRGLGSTAAIGLGWMLWIAWSMRLLRKLRARRSGGVCGSRTKPPE